MAASKEFYHIKGKCQFCGEEALFGNIDDNRVAEGWQHGKVLYDYVCLHCRKGYWSCSEDYNELDISIYAERIDK